MVAGTTQLLNLEEYRARYASEKGYEFWFGEVVRKAVPTWLHSILQILIGELLTKAGYAAGSELELRIDPEWEPKPDIAASLESEDPYPTKAIDIVAEIPIAGRLDAHGVPEMQSLCAVRDRTDLRT